MSPIISGLAYGFGISFMLGTVFFTLIQQGLKHGAKAGVAIATGVIITDIIFISLAYWFTDLASVWIENHKTVITLGGGIFIIGMGIFGLIKKSKVQESKEEKSDFSPFKLMGIGATLNATNPVNFFVWLTLQTLLLSKGYKTTEIVTFFTASLAAIFMAEVAFAWLAFYVKNKLNRKVLVYIKTGINVIFIAIGLYLVISVLL
jgi:threonine/homoserine/homoserine lactone efflux protein